MINTQVVDGIKRRKIDSLGYFFASLDLERRLVFIGGNRRDRLTLASGDFQSKPRLALTVVQIDISSSEVGDAERSHHWFISDVLQSLEFQFDLNLPVGSADKQEHAGDAQQQQLHDAVE